MKASSRKNPQDQHHRPVKGTRFHELHLYPLPSDADKSKVRALIEPLTGVKLKEIRIHKKNSSAGASAFVVFFDDASAASVIKAFRNDPLFVENKKVDVKYTIDYEEPVRRSRGGKPSQQLVNRIRAAFSWNTENNIRRLNDLPAQLEEIIPCTSFTDINSSFSCKKQHIVCKTFDKSGESSIDCPPVLCSTDIPKAVQYSCNEVLKFHKILQSSPTNATSKPSKSVKRRAARKRENVLIEAKLDKQQNCVPLKPGMGRGFNQQGRDVRTVIAPGSINHQRSKSVTSKKPLAVICPTIRDTEYTHESEATNKTFSSPKYGEEMQKSAILNKGRGRRVITAEMMAVLQKY